MPASGSLRQKSTGLLVGYDQLHFVQEYHFLTHFNPCFLYLFDCQLIKAVFYNSGMAKSGIWGCFIKFGERLIFHEKRCFLG